MTQQELKQEYSRPNWQTWFGDIFGSQVQFETQAEKIEMDKESIKSAERFAVVKLADGKGFFTPILFFLLFSGGLCDLFVKKLYLCTNFCIWAKF